MGKDILEGTMSVYVSWTKAREDEERRLQEKKEFLKSVFPFQVFSFVRYKILLRIGILLHFVSLFLFYFFFRRKRPCSLSKRC